MHHIFLNFYLRRKRVYIFSTLNHETFKYKNPELAHEYNSQMFNKMSRKNTF